MREYLIKRKSNYSITFECPLSPSEPFTRNTQNRYKIINDQYAAVTVAPSGLSVFVSFVLYTFVYAIQISLYEHITKSARNNKKKVSQAMTKRSIEIMACYERG